MYARLERTDLRGIPRLFVMEMMLQPKVTWKNVLFGTTDR